MTDLGDMLNPVVDPETFQRLKSGWDQTLTNLGQGLAKPVNQSALLSIGGQLGQSPQWGQNPTAQVLSALGAGGESVRQTEALDLKQQEAESKGELRGSQAQLAESRAREAGLGKDLKGREFDLRERAFAEKQLNNRYKAILGLQAAHKDYLKGVNATNAEALINRNVKPVQALSFEQWLRANPHFALQKGWTLEELGYGGADEPGTPGAPAAPGTPTPPGASKKTESWILGPDGRTPVRAP